MFLQALFFTAAILLCAVRGAQFKARITQSLVRNENVKSIKQPSDAQRLLVVSHISRVRGGFEGFERTPFAGQ